MLCHLSIVDLAYKWVNKIFPKACNLQAYWILSQLYKGGFSANLLSDCTNMAIVKLCSTGQALLTKGNICDTGLIVLGEILFIYP